MASLKLIYLFTLFIFITFITTEADLDDDIPTYSCSPYNQTTPNSAYYSNLKRLLSYLSSNASAKKQFYKITVTSTNPFDSVCGMFGCGGKVPTELRSKCVTNRTVNILSDWYSSNCSLSTDVWFGSDVCVLRYSNCSSFSNPDLSLPSGSCPLTDVSNHPNFVRLLSETIDQVADEAADFGNDTKNYDTKKARICGYQSLYCEAKCTPDLSPLDCTKCLNVTVTEGQQFCVQGLVRMQNPSYSVRCDVYPFYRLSFTLAPSELVPVTNYSNRGSDELVYLSRNCSSTVTIDNTFLSNLRTLLSFLHSNSSHKDDFFTTKVAKVNGLFMCRMDFSTTLCQLCVINATQRITSECPSSKEAVIWYNHYLLRYCDRPYLSTLDTVEL